MLMIWQVYWMGYNHTVKPLYYASPRSHKLEVLTDWTILFTIYCVICFTDLVLDYQTRYFIGWFLLAAHGMTIAISIGFVAVDAINGLIRKYRKRKF